MVIIYGFIFSIIPSLISVYIDELHCANVAGRRNSLSCCLDTFFRFLYEPCSSQYEYEHVQYPDVQLQRADSRGGRIDRRILQFQMPAHNQCVIHLLGQRTKSYVVLLFLLAFHGMLLNLAYHQRLTIVINHIQHSILPLLFFDQGSRKLIPIGV